MTLGGGRCVPVARKCSISRKIHGRPWAARPIMTASAPVYSRTNFAFSGVVTSPLATTGIETERFTARIVSYSASPVYMQARVRPCMASDWMPCSSAIFATRSALRFSLFQPVRILSVTGTWTALTTASMMRATSGSSCSSAEPAKTLQIFFAGQPMLMSMMSAPLSTLYFAASAIIAGSAPAIWITLGSTSPSWLPRRMVFSDPHRSELDATISDTAIPAPIALQRLRKGRSVTPAMGATMRLFLSWMEPIFKLCDAPSRRNETVGGLSAKGKVLILYAAQFARKLNFALAHGRVVNLTQKVNRGNRRADHL